MLLSCRLWWSLCRDRDALGLGWQLQRKHRSVSHYPWTLAACTVLHLAFHGFGWCCRARGPMCPYCMYSIVHGNAPPFGVPLSCAPLLPMGALWRLVCVVVHVPRCASAVRPKDDGALSPHTVLCPLCARVHASFSSGFVVLAYAGALGRFGILARRCCGQCGPVVRMTLLSLAQSSLHTLSRCSGRLCVMAFARRSFPKYCRRGLAGRRMGGWQGPMCPPG